MNEEKSKVLVVEDENDIRKLMCLHLERNDYLITEATEGSQAYELLEKNKFNVIILDWMLPGMSGLDLLVWIRSQNEINKITPILFVTAKSEPEDIVKALDSGADDYVVKPFNIPVLLARVQSLLRRNNTESILEIQKKQPQLSIGHLKINRDSHKVYMDNKEVSLTLSEFLLLETLLLNQGKVLSRQQLIQYIQGENTNVTGRTIDTHTSVLRKKIGEYGNLIETVRGVGYRIGYINESK